MRLDRLEISGFKSFPDRADLAFDQGVTAIVGPNGCGKSNVVDAITWVLGEQSARSLRGERMEDVIFNGSDARRPTAAAEVRLRLSGVSTIVVRRTTERLLGAEPLGPTAAETDDEVPQQFELPEAEARQVELGRRLYRSGESEYLIDGEICRLRDVQDLLMDAGLGVKGYAVIEQGKIGQILTAKPTDRRQLIEEAAGVTKYKSRRRTAELKLEAAQQNLTRLDDIIFEVEKQRMALRRQASKARRYRRLREELRRFEKVLFARRYRALAEAIDAARSSLEAARAAEGAAVARLSALERELEQIRERLAQADARATDAREQAHARELDRSRREEQLRADREQLARLTESIAALDDERQALEGRVEPARQELDARRAAAQQAAEEGDAAATALADEESAHSNRHHGLETADAELDAARRRVFGVQSARATLDTVLERASESRERLVAELARLEAEASDLVRERAQLEGVRQAASIALEHRGREIAELRAAHAMRVAEVAAARGARDAYLQQVRTREREHDARLARLRSLEEFDAARQGFGEAARVILADPTTGVAHHGSVADYLETDRVYERAVEAALGDLLQAVLVPSLDVSRTALEFVRRRGLGRSSFIVVEGGSSAPQDAEPWPDGLRPLSAVIRATGPHADVVRELTAGAWVAESGEVAAAAARHVNGFVATLGGDVFRGGRIVTGGARAEARGILATKREIKELRDQLTTEQAELERVVAEASLYESRISAAEEAVSVVAGALHEQEKGAIGDDLQQSRALDELDRVSRKLELIANERRKAEEERQALDARERDARASIDTLESERQAVDSWLVEVQRRVLEAREAAADQARRLAEAKARHAALEERAAALGTDVGRLETALADLDERIAGRRADLDRAHQLRERLDHAVGDGVRLLEEDSKGVEAARETARLAEEAVLRLQTDLFSHEGAVRAARADVEGARASVAHLDLARVTAESDLAHLEATCEEHLQATLTDVAAEVEALERAGEISAEGPVSPVADAEPEPEAEGEPAGDAAVGEGAPAEAAVEAQVAPVSAPLTVEEAIAGLREKIDRLGPVNMMAIEQFDELETRHGFLSAQRQDLVESITTTGEAIKRIERTTRERFREAFVAINRYFEETFTTLFGGGRAGLVLLDEDDMLESGIDIIAQPPGKRLQNVQLLSGGEKALTAMALMFAIFKYRPSPFCLLDEIDAPLDDANIGRFIEMLRGMQEQTQFILVTHSRKTMEIADRLYGVTMEEPGVSKLISVELN